MFTETAELRRVESAMRNPIPRASGTSRHRERLTDRDCVGILVVSNARRDEISFPQKDAWIERRKLAQRKAQDARAAKADAPRLSASQRNAHASIARTTSITQARAQFATSRANASALQAQLRAKIGSVTREMTA